MVELNSLQEVFDLLVKTNGVTCSTVDENGDVQSRIIGLVTCDEDGIYIRMEGVKPFYKQIAQHNQIALCGHWSGGQTTHDENGIPVMQPGFMIRLNGIAREMENDEVFAKEANNPDFRPATRDIKVYPTTKVFVIEKGWAEIFDYDFGKVNRDHKLERARLAFGGATHPEPGLVIDPDKCVGCGCCYGICTYDAIIPGSPYVINGYRCDECGNCYLSCPADAISHHGLFEK